jgi:hypothetical protein
MAQPRRMARWMDASAGDSRDELDERRNEFGAVPGDCGRQPHADRRDLEENVTSGYVVGQLMMTILSPCISLRPSWSRASMDVRQ